MKLLKCSGGAWHIAAAADTTDNDDDFTIYVDYANYSDDTLTFAHLTSAR